MFLGCKLYNSAGLFRYGMFQCDSRMHGWLLHCSHNAHKQAHSSYCQNMSVSQSVKRVGDRNSVLALNSAGSVNDRWPRMVGWGLSLAGVTCWITALRGWHINWRFFISHSSRRSKSLPEHSHWIISLGGLLRRFQTTWYSFTPGSFSCIIQEFDYSSIVENVKDAFLETLPPPRPTHVKAIISAVAGMAIHLLVIVTKSVRNLMITQEDPILEPAFTP